MEEIVTMYGNSFKIWYNTLEDRVYAIKEAENIYKTLNESKGSLESLVLAASCPSQTNKTVGETVALSASPTSGTPPYTYSFYKIVPGSTTPTWLLGTATTGQALNNYTYVTLPGDVTTVNGKLKVGVIVFDSCVAGVKTSEEWCFVNVTVACGTPLANLVIA